MRILNEQWERLSRAVGNVFLPIVAKVLPYLNAVLMVLTEIINMIASLFGYKEEDFDYFGSMADSVMDLESGLGGAGENAKKLKQGLRGFDKLNVISSSSGNGKGSGIGSGISPEILDEFNKAFDDYNSKLTDVKMKATRIRDIIMEWLGFTKVIDKDTNKVSFKFDHITGGTVLGALGIGGVIYSGIHLIYKVLKKIGLLKFTDLTKLFGKNSGLFTFLKSNPKIMLIVGSVGLLLGAFVKLYDKSEDFRDTVDDFFHVLKETFAPLLKTIWDVIKLIYKDVLEPLGDLLLQILKPVLKAILDLLKNIFEKVIQPLTPILKDVAESVLPVIESGIKAISKVIEVVIDILSWLWEHILEKMFDFISKKIKEISKVITWLKDHILEPLARMIKDKIDNQIVPAIESIQWVVDKIKNAIQKVVDWWNNLSFNKKHIEVEYHGGGGRTSGQGTSRGFAKGGILVNGNWQPIQNYALGGLPPVGQMFVAREKGAELVGNLGGHTAVMNNDQIVASVSDGVYRAMRMANGNKNNNSDIFNIYLDQDHKLGTYTLDELKDMARSNGEQIIIG